MQNYIKNKTSLRFFKRSKDLIRSLSFAVCVCLLLSGCSFAENSSSPAAGSNLPGKNTGGSTGGNNLISEAPNGNGSGGSTAGINGSDASSEAAGSASCSRDIFAMDTIMTITCYGERCEEAAEAAEAEIKRLDSLLSTGSSESEISQLNASGSAALSSDSRIMIQKALDIYDATGGAFDITVYPLMQLWGFPSHDYHVPDADAINAALQFTGSDKLSFDGTSISLEPGMGIDLGGIAKGYTSDKLAEIFEEYGLTSGLISLGGNVHVYGHKPDGSLWRCGIRDPHDPESIYNVLGVLETSDCAVITSGAYERFFTGEDGNTYHHIIDPSTGYPADSGIISSTIVSKSGLLADALSTAVYVMGLEEASRLWSEHSDEFEMILMTDSDEVYITEGLEGSFKSDYPLHIIHK